MEHCKHCGAHATECGPDQTQYACGTMEGRKGWVSMGVDCLIYMQDKIDRFAADHLAAGVEGEE